MLKSDQASMMAALTLGATVVCVALAVTHCMTGASRKEQIVMFILAFVVAFAGAGMTLQMFDARQRAHEIELWGPALHDSKVKQA